MSTSTPAEIADHFGAEVDDDDVGGHEPSWNVAPTREVLVVGERPAGDSDADHEHRQRSLKAARWGLVPFWAKDPSIGNRMINARAEKVATSNAYKRPFAERRCIIPADAFYEWTEIPGRRRKQPWLFRRADGEPLAFAGLWDTWTDAEGNRLRSCVIITCDANDAVAEIHERMPVILPESGWADWLDPANHDTDALQRLLVPAPPDLLTRHPVSTDVNDVANDTSDLVDPVDLDPDPDPETETETENP